MKCPRPPGKSLEPNNAECYYSNCSFNRAMGTKAPWAFAIPLKPLTPDRTPGVRGRTVIDPRFGQLTEGEHHGFGHSLIR